MNDLAVLASVRADVPPLTATERAALRAAVFGDLPVSDHEEALVARSSADEDLPPIATPIAWAADGGARPARPQPPQRNRGLLAVAASIVAAVGLAGVWIATDREQPQDDPATPVTVPASTPAWYEPIRALLPEGFDQIAITEATTDVIAFKAFDARRLVLDVSVVLTPGFGYKETTDTITSSDEHGRFFESISGATLITPDERLVAVRCGLAPIGGGGVGWVSMVDSEHDTCRDVDAGALGAEARKQLVVRLAEELTPDVAAAAIGAPVRRDGENAPVIQLLDAYAGQAVELMTQYSGALRSMGLGPDATGPHDTELTVVHGIWPPRAADVVPTNGLAPSGAARFAVMGEAAVAMVVAPDGTGFHVITTDLGAEHLQGLGELLDQLADLYAESYGPLTTDPATTATTQVAPTQVAPTPPLVTVAPDSALAEAMEPGTILIVNASHTDGLAMSLTDVLRGSGYDVIDPQSPADGARRPDSVIYTQPAASAAVRDQVGELLRMPAMRSPAPHDDPAVDDDMLASADIIVVLGDDLADAPWTDQTVLPFDPLAGVGALLMLDATTTSAGHELVQQRIAQLSADGVVVVDGGAPARPVSVTMLMPIGDSTPWTYAVAELAGIGGFGSWDPTLVIDPLPSGVAAVLVIADE